MIEMKHLNIKFKDHIIFDDASFKTARGKMVCITGKSGTGKTTFLKALLYEFQSELYIDGIQIHNKNKQDYLFNEVSYIDQFNTCFENMKIIQHFQFISMIKNHKLDYVRMKEMLHFVGLDHIEIQSFPSKLSTG